MRTGTRCASFSTGKPIRFRVGFTAADTSYPYISVLIHNNFGDRVATLHSTHINENLSIKGDGFVECVVDDLRLGEGTYYVMADYGSFPNLKDFLISMDCVPNAAQIEVSLGGYVEGTGHDAYRGAVHRSRWSVHRKLAPAQCQEGVCAVMLNFFSRLQSEKAAEEQFSFVAVGYPKVGNTWLRLTLGRYVQRLADLPDLPLFEPGDFQRLAEAVGREGAGYFTHAPLEWTTQTASELSHENVVRPFQRQKVLLLVRHPLDALVSLHKQYVHRS